jgi:hypothetical protein
VSVRETGAASVCQTNQITLIRHFKADDTLPTISISLRTMSFQNPNSEISIGFIVRFVALKYFERDASSLEERVDTVKVGHYCFFSLLLVVSWVGEQLRVIYILKLPFQNDSSLHPKPLLSAKRVLSDTFSLT